MENSEEKLKQITNKVIDYNEFFKLHLGMMKQKISPDTRDALLEENSVLKFLLIEDIKEILNIKTKD